MGSGRGGTRYKYKSVVFCAFFSLLGKDRSNPSLCSTQLCSISISLFILSSISVQCVCVWSFFYFSCFAAVCMDSLHGATRSWSQPWLLFIIQFNLELLLSYPEFFLEVQFTWEGTSFHPSCVLI